MLQMGGTALSLRARARRRRKCAKPLGSSLSTRILRSPSRETARAAEDQRKNSWADVCSHKGWRKLRFLLRPSVLLYSIFPPLLLRCSSGLSRRVIRQAATGRAVQSYAEMLVTPLLLTEPEMTRWPAKFSARTLLLGCQSLASRAPGLRKTASISGLNARI